MKELLSARGAAKRLGISHVAVMRQIACEKLQPFGRLDSGIVVFEPEYIDRIAGERARSTRSIYPRVTSVCTEFGQETSAT